MTKTLIPKACTIFFDVGHFRPSSELKSFITYLKYQKVPTPINFSYVETHTTLIDKLTLEDNICLGLPFLNQQQKIKLSEYIKSTNNQYLLCLYNQIGDLQLHPRDINSNKIKLVMILIGLLKKSPYLFLDLPELNLMDFQLNTLIKAINHNISYNNQTIFIRTNQKKVFPTPYQIIIKNKDGSFTHTDNNQKHDVIDEQQEGYIKFIQYRITKNQAA